MPRAPAQGGTFGPSAEAPEGCVPGLRCAACRRSPSTSCGSRLARSTWTAAPSCAGPAGTRSPPTPARPHRSRGRCRPESRPSGAGSSSRWPPGRRALSGWPPADASGRPRDRRPSLLARPAPQPRPNRARRPPVGVRPVPRGRCGRHRIVGRMVTDATPPFGRGLGRSALDRPAPGQTSSARSSPGLALAAWHRSHPHCPRCGSPPT